MKKILLVLAVAAFVLSSCGTKSTAKTEEVTEETPVMETETVEPDSTAVVSEADSLQTEVEEAVTEEEVE